ncbi:MULTISPECIES: glycosyltransferase family 4 protein [Sphingobacterium]|uniref:glycosyltransferase family 4 protein n=2 Tax=Sphingobacterium TaxID=28453 RepID=UPI00257D7AFC|nr:MULTISPECIES: glycosyltransferase family 4 protein [Sphingobacterium]
MNKPSILFYFNSMTPAGGIERVIATLANKFSEFMKVTILVKDKAFSHYYLKEEITLLSLENEIRFNMNNRLSRLLEVSKNFISSQRKLREFLTSQSYDYYYVAHPMNVLELHIARGIDNKVVISEHGDIDAYNFFYKRIKKLLYNRAKAYVVPTKTDTSKYSTLGYRAIYIPHFRSDLPYRRSLQNKNTAISIGRMTQAKRQWILINLWDRIVNIHQIRDWMLYIIGDGNLKSSLQQQIDDLGIGNYVKLLPPKKEVEDYYNNASFFLLTSKSEGFGMVILEAMSFGVPCISYDCPSGPRDMIRNKKDGYLVEQDNFNELERATLELIKNREKMISFGEASFISSERWSEKNILKKWKRILS